MAVNLSPIGGVAGQFFDNNGDPLSGGKIYTYFAGTTAPAVTYLTSTGTAPHTNPIVLDAAGRPPGGEIWLTNGLEYKFIIKTSADVQIGSYDNVSGINSSLLNYTIDQEIQTATASQTVFTLTTMQYQPGTNSLSVFVDGINQYGPGASYAYEETSSTVVTFTSGLTAGAEVKFTSAVINSSSYAEAAQVGYTPPYTGSKTTNVEIKLGQTVSVKDFGAVGDGVTDDTSAIQTALNTYSHVIVPVGTYLITSTINVPLHTRLEFQGGLGNTLGSYPTAYFIKSALMTTAGITVSGTAYVTGGGLICQNGNAGDGVVLNGNSAKISHFLVHGAGNDGIRIGVDGVTSNYNSCEITQCVTQYNGRYGLYIHDGKPDTSTGANANVCTVTQVFAQHNGSDGIRLGFCWWTTLINCLCEVNGGYGLYLSGADASSYPACRWATVLGGDYNEVNALGVIYDQSYFSTFYISDFNQVPTTAGAVLQGSAWRTAIAGNNIFTARVTFPATQITSANPNTLDDYEEGTWTPAQAGVTLTVGSAAYTKIGRQVFYTFDITWPVTADATTIQITGFVHAPQINSGTFTPGYTTYTTNRFSGVTGPLGLILYHTGDTTLTNANLSGARIIGSGTYFAAT